MSISNILTKYSKHSSKVVYLSTFDSPIGKIIAAADEDFIYMVSSLDSKNLEKMITIIVKELNCYFIEKKNTNLEKFERQLTDYFQGKLKQFTVPIKTIGSEFQKEVWDKLCKLPYGSTQSYGDLAKTMNRPASHSRAVGAACGANAHLLVIPCHRLVAASSKGGFSSGIERKEWLLEHEKNYS